jgi:hypothetical protein
MSYLTGKDGERQRKGLLYSFSFLALSSLLAVTAISGIIKGKLLSLPLFRPEAVGDAISLGNPAVFIPMVTMSACLVLLLFAGRFARLKYALLLVVFLEALSYKSLYSYPAADTIEDYRRPLFEFLAGDRENRVAFINLEVPDSMLALRYGISSIDGFDPLIIDDYGNFLEMAMYGYSDDWPELIENNIILSLLNTRYIVVDENHGDLEEVEGLVRSAGDGRRLFGPPIGRGLPDTGDYQPVYRKVFEERGSTVYENLNVFPRTSSVRRLVLFDNAFNLSVDLFAFQMDPREEAAVLEEDLDAIGRNGFSAGEVRIEEYKTDEVTLETAFPDTGFVVLADQYYPGWRAYVDGVSVKIYRTNGVLRGVVVPPGEHKLVFRYVPVRIYAGMIISGLTILSSIAILARRNGWKK